MYVALSGSVEGERQRQWGVWYWLICGAGRILAVRTGPCRTENSSCASPFSCREKTQTGKLKRPWTVMLERETQFKDTEKRTVDVWMWWFINSEGAYGFVAEPHHKGYQAKKKKNGSIKLYFRVDGAPTFYLLFVYKQTHSIRKRWHRVSDWETPMTNTLNTVASLWNINRHKSTWL